MVSKVNTVPAVAAEEIYDQDLFEKFIQQLPVWSYANRRQEDFISLLMMRKK